MSSSEISDRITEKLKKIVKDPIEFKMIVDLLQHEKRYSAQETPQTVKRQFQLLINQYFPLENSENE